MKTSKEILFGKKTWIALAILVIFLALFGASSLKAKSYVYVDDDASGTMDGSSDHPYDEIQDAINRAKKKDKDVYIKKGEYVENIEIWGGVEVVGADRDKVTIKGKKGDQPVVEMYDKTSIQKVTIRKGRHGVKVREGAAATIKKCEIKDNYRDGINVKDAKTSNRKKLRVVENEIHDNDWSGIYSEMRKVYIFDNEIFENGKDGIDMEKRSEGVIKSNYIAKNRGVGIKMAIDDSADSYINKNTLRDNRRDGIEIRAYGENGFIQIDRNKLYQNKRWGIARIEKEPFRDDQWNASLKIIGDNVYWENGNGQVSPIISVY